MTKRIFVLVFTFLIICACVTPVVTQALPSPTPSQEYNVVIQPTQGGGGTYHQDGNSTYILEAKPKDGYVFSHWEFVGSYKILEGDINSKKIKILIYSDVIAIPYYSKNGEVDRKIIDVNTSNISPKTGDTHTYNYHNKEQGKLLILYSCFLLILVVLFYINRSR